MIVRNEFAEKSEVANIWSSCHLSGEEKLFLLIQSNWISHKNTQSVMPRALSVGVSLNQTALYPPFDLKILLEILIEIYLKKYF